MHMTKTSFHPVWIVWIPILLLAQACAPPPPPATATPTEAPPTPTVTATLAPTSTPRPTITPPPTKTPIPTAAPLGVAVPNGSLEITVLDAVTRKTLHLGDISGRYELVYYAPTGSKIIDVGVLMHNSVAGSPASAKWGDIYIVEENGDAWIPYWGSTKTVASGSSTDPFSMGLSSNDLDREAEIQLQDDTYLRLIFLVGDKPGQTFLFGVADSPLITFQAKP
jgi:hypothetical protein